MPTTRCGLNGCGLLCDLVDGESHSLILSATEGRYLLSAQNLVAQVRFHGFKNLRGELSQLLQLAHVVKAHFRPFVQSRAI